jgi:hypothetical protein
MAWTDIIDRFNDGDESFLSHFNDSYANFFKILAKRDLLDLIDFESNNDTQAYWINHYLIALYGQNIERFHEIIIELYLSDVKIKDGKIYFYDYDSEELSRLFCRKDNSEDIAEKILSGDFDTFIDIDREYVDLYDEVIGSLNIKNKVTLANEIILKLREVNVKPNTDILSEIAEEQGNEFVIVNDSNINTILEDRESILYILDEYISDIEDTLYNIYSNSYESAHNDMIHKEVWSELSRYFIGTGEQILNDKTKKYTFYLEIRDFDKVILSFLKLDVDTLEYHGSYLNVLIYMEKCLSIRDRDYPDYRTISDNINEYFLNYM